MKADTRDETLRRLLREMDGAADDPGLTREESREMRRTVLNAIPEDRRRAFLAPALAGAAVVALAVVASLTLWPGSPPQTAPPRQQIERVAVSSRPDMNARATDGAPSGTNLERVPAGTTAGSPAASAPGAGNAVRVRHARSTPPDRVASSPLAPLAEETSSPEVETHQVQFSTPGGTRIIWVLTSDKASE
jgi:hypothetical protein